MGVIGHSSSSTRRSRRLRAAAIGSLLAITLAACGGSSSPAAPTQTPTATPTTPAPVTPEPEFKPLAGQRVTLVHGHSPAGGYQAYAQLIAPFLAEELGADVVVEVEQGAGGLVALRSTYRGLTDGTRIQLLNGPGTGNSFLARDPNLVGIDLGAIQYLGQVSGEPMAVFVGVNSEFQTFEDMLNASRPIRFGTSGPGSADWAPPRIFEDIFDMPLNLITGFDTAEIITAILRGDIDAMVSTIDSRREQVEDGLFRPLVLMATERTDAEWFTALHPNVPAQTEFGGRTTPEGALLLEINALVTGLGRSLIVNPNTPDDIVQYLREAFERMMSNPAFLAASEERGLALTYVPGGSYQETVVRIVGEAPARYGQLLGE